MPVRRRRPVNSPGFAAGGGDFTRERQKGSGSAGQTKAKNGTNIAEVRANVFWWLSLVSLTVIAAVLHRDHVFTLFENDKHFSHLSNLEREMAFRTEMGLYYSYYKTIIHAPSFAEGLHQITHDKLTEYPDTINTLKRFNLYPEVILGLGYRMFKNYTETNNIETVKCWGVNRGAGKSQVSSCEGIGDPMYFYVHGVMSLNGLMMAVYFLFGTFLSKSLFGGIITVAAYFFNHGECTRVMWTPPLRESFAFPILIIEMFWLSYMLRMRRPGLMHSLVLALGIVGFMLPWQFAQFALMTQLIAVLGCFVLKYINQNKMKYVLLGHTLGLLTSFVLLMGNEMLLTSFYASCILSIWVLLGLNNLLEKIKLRPLIVIVQGVILLTGMISLKMILGKILQVEDDAHIGDILKSKFGNFVSFDTQLYTCAKEFDFLEYSTYLKLFSTLLIPLMVFSTAGAVCFLMWREWWNYTNNEAEGVLSDDDNEDEKEHAEVLYNILQMIAFIAMAVIIMRLKLFATPQLCLISSLVASRGFFSFYPILQNIWLHRAFLILLLGGMAVQGSQNLARQKSISGEYQNYPMEELIEWINESTPKDAAFGGPMPTMANIKLSTNRPIINHPHYEDAGLRARTKKIYSLASRKSVKEVYEIVKALKVDYVVYEGGWCLRSGAKTGCTMPEIWDVEDPENKGKPPTCLVIMKKPEPYFKKVYHNSKFDVFKVL